MTDATEERPRVAIHPSDPRVNPNHVNTSLTYRILNFRPADWLYDSLAAWQPRTLKTRKDPPPAPPQDVDDAARSITVSHQPLDQAAGIYNSSNPNNKLANLYI